MSYFWEKDDYDEPYEEEPSSSQRASFFLSRVYYVLKKNTIT